MSDPGGGPGIPDPLYYISNDLTLRERPGPAAYCHLPGSSEDWSGEGGTEQEDEDMEEGGDVEERSGRGLLAWRVPVLAECCLVIF